jgi:hypothetical protein
MKIFSNDFIFSIPRYQRPYSWTTEHSGELLQDLLDALNAAGDVESSGPYFLGSIVLIKGDSAGAQVVDGQQRLTTLTILLSVLRSLGSSEDKSDLTSYIYQKGKRLEGTKDRPRLTLRPKDQPFFWDYIQHEDGLEKLNGSANNLSSSKENIRNNALYLKEKVNELPAERRTELGMFIIQRCYLVAVSTPDLDSAYRIFSVLNDRGMELSHTDILKADIIGSMPEDHQDNYTNRWEETEEDLGRGTFQTLFGHIRMIRQKAKARDSLLKELRDYVNPSAEPKKFMDETLLPMAQAFGEIRGRSYESDRLSGDINRLMRWLSRIDNVDWESPAILYLSRHRQNPEQLLRFFRDLERLAAGMMIRRANINHRLERYGRLLRAIESEVDLYHEDSPLQLKDDERKHILEILAGNLYNMPRIPRPVLLRLDEALSEGEARYDHGVISIEHVLPQHPPANSQWLEWFPDEEQREAWTHRLGNLVLLSKRKNSQARNFDFERKKREYFQRQGVTSFAITTEVINAKEWTLEILEERQNRLMETLSRIWRL